MKKKRGFTLIELLVVIAIIAMLLAILMPALNKVKKIAQRVICGTNLKGLGTAQNVYANDYEDQFAKQGGSRPLTWSWFTDNWPDSDVGWQGTENRGITVGASLYLLVREADVSPKSFVCPSGGETPYDGKNPWNNDLVELWDFGKAGSPYPPGPFGAVSYSYHDPYGRRAASGSATASFAIMADRNPFFDPKLEWASGPDPALANAWTGKIVRIPPYWVTGSNYEKWMIQVGNSQPHGREGQNVLFGDGHNAFEKTPDCGVRNDNIYTLQGGPTTDGQDIRCGRTNADLYARNACLVANVQTGQGLDPAHVDDSLLVNDFPQP